MKKLLSIILAISMMLVVPAGITHADEMTAGEELRAMGLIKGDNYGNLNEDAYLTRAEMMVVLSRINGVEDQALSYDLPPVFLDAQSHWASNYIAYAYSVGWTLGIDELTFAPNEKVTFQQVATFVLRVLKYDDKAGDFTYKNAVEKGVEVGFIVEGSGDKEPVLRGDLFIAIKKALNVYLNGQNKTLADILGIIVPGEIKDFVDSIEALSYVIVEVGLKKPWEPVMASDFTINDEDGNEHEIVSVKPVDSETAWVETKPQAPGVLYTMEAGENDFDFTGVAKDKVIPEVEIESYVKDNTTLIVYFSKDMDRRNAIEISNYLIDGGLEVLGAQFGTEDNGNGDTDYKKVILRTASQVPGRVYELTALEGITDIAGNSVETEDDKNTFKFGGLGYDTDKPEISNIQGINANKLSVYFFEDSDLTKATAEDVTNYVITNKSDSNHVVIVESAELVKYGDNYTKVNLRTTTQELGDTYELSISNVTDKFGNVIKAKSKKLFVGQPADTKGPKVLMVTGLSNDTIRVTFNEELEKHSAENASNYKINNGLIVLTAKLIDSNGGDMNIVELETTSHTESTIYKLTVSNIFDEYGNKVGSDDYGYFAGIGLQDGKPKLTGAYAVVESNMTYVYAVFDRNMETDTTEIASNYYFGSEIGYAVSAKQNDDSLREFKIRVNELEEDKVYTLAVKNVTDASGNVIDSDEDEKEFVGKAEDDTELPEVVGAVTLDNLTTKVIFSKDMEGQKEVVTQTPPVSEENFANNPDNYVLVDRDTSNMGSGIVTVNSAYFEDDENSVVLNLAKELKSGHVYELYVNACKYTSSSDRTLITDIHTDLTTPFSAVGLRSENGLPLNADDGTTLIGGTSSDLELLEIESIFSTSEETVTVNFNKDIDISTVTGTFANQESGNDFTISNAVIDSNDTRTLQIKVNGQFEDADKFILTITSGVTNKYDGELLTSGTNRENVSDEFYSSTQGVQKPAIYDLYVLEDGKLQIMFTKDMAESIITNTGVFKILNDKGVDAFKNVEFNNGDKNVLNAYFDNTDMTPGKVYKLVADENLMFDVLGFLPDDDEEVEFSIVSDVPADAPSVLEVSYRNGVYRMIMNESVKFSIDQPFIINSDSAIAINIGDVFEDGDEIVYESWESLDDVFVDILEFTAFGVSSSNTNEVSLLGTMTNKFGVPVNIGTVLDRFTGIGDPYVAVMSPITSDAFVGTAYTLNLSTQIIDPDGDALTYSVVSSSGAGTSTITGSTLSYTPLAGDASTIVELVLKANDGIYDSNHLTIKLTVNSKPVGTNQTANEIVGNLYSLDLDTIFTDADNDPMTYTVVGDDGASTAVMNGDSVEYTPVAGDSGNVVVITVKANDMKEDSSSVMIILTVNAKPVGTNQTANGVVGNLYSLDLNTIFTDGDGDPMTYSVVGDDGASTAVMNGDFVEYTPVAGDLGNAVVITVKANDTKEDSSNVTVTLTVNAKPVGTNQTANGTVGNLYSLDLNTVFTDGDGDLMTYTVVGDDGASTAVMTGDFVEYTPVAGDSGNTVVITIKANDTKEDSDDVTITLSVN